MTKGPKVMLRDDAADLDSRLSTVLGDEKLQNFAHAMWFYENGRIGLYCRVLDELVGTG